MIPRLIHQIWVGPNSIPDREAEWCARTAAMNPKWGHNLYGNELLEKYGQDPYIRIMLSKNEKWAYVTDRLRVLLLRDRGGLYIDADAEPQRSLDSLAFWQMPHVDFVAGLRSPTRKDVALHRAIPIVDNTFLGSAPNGRMIRLIDDLWRPGEVTGDNVVVNGHKTGLCIISNADWTTVLLNHRYVYCEQLFPESLVAHDFCNLGSWTQQGATKPRMIQNAPS
jgi:hypothetical protein